MEDFKERKSRGKKHIADTARYKNKPKSSAIRTKHQDTALESNWDRYKPLDDDLNTTSDYITTDFAILANAPLSVGGHFQFKNDKQLASSIQNDEQINLFNLDLNLLNASLTTIPFNERCCIENDIFKEEKLIKMKQKAEAAERRYKRMLDNVEIVFNESQDNEFDKNVVKSVCENVEDDLVEELLQINTPVQKQETEPSIKCNKNLPCTTASKNNDVDLEQWLEDILDD